jgi:Rv0078B-related antitoxin
MLADEQTSPEQFEIYRRMTPERRLAIAEQLYWTARRMKSSWLRSQHPDWPEEKVLREVTRIFSHART